MIYHFIRKELSATVDYRHSFFQPSQPIPLCLPSLFIYNSPPVFCRFVADCWFMVLSQTTACIQGFHHVFTFRMAIINIGPYNRLSLFFGLRRRCSTRRPPSISKTTSASPLPSLPPPNTSLSHLCHTYSPQTPKPGPDCCRGLSDNAHL